MLQILLLVLKILGILLASVIGLIILAALLVLLVPVRYRAWGAGNFQNKEFEGDIRLTWLFHLISVRGIWTEGKFRLRVRAAGIPFYDSARPKKEKKNKRIPAEEPGEEPVIAALETPTVSEDTGGRGPDPVPVKEEHDQKAEKKKNKPGFLGWLRYLFRKWKRKLRELVSRAKNWKDRAEALAERIRYFWNLAHSPHFCRAWKKVKKELLRVVRHMRPKRLEADLHIGLENPADMGKVTAIAGMLYPVYTDHIRFRPDFEQQALEGKVSLRGRLRFGTLGLAGLRVVLDQDVKRVIKEVKSGK